MAKVITLKISLDAGNVLSEVDDIGNAFDTLAKVDARNAKEAIDRIDHTTLNQIKSQIHSIGDTLQQAGSRIKGFGQTLAITVTAPIAALGALGIKFDATREQSEMAFKVMLKSGEKAKQMMNDLIKFSDSTPFESTPIVNAGKQLVAFGVDAKDVIPILTDLGDAAATFGTEKLPEIVGAFGKLKSSQFGEAFERFRDFGVTLKDLEGKGLKFDKSGQYQGSVEAAMTAVRQIIREKFGGTMDEQSKTFSGRLSTLFDRANTALGKIFEPAFEAAKPLIDGFISVLDSLMAAFNSLSPEAKTLATVILGIAAGIAPVLIVLGSVVGFIAPIISGFLSLGLAVSAAGGIFAFLGTVVTAVGGFITATLIPAVIALAPVILAAVAVIAALAAAGVALFLAWQTNFGGIRDYTLQVWTVVKSAVQTAMTFIYSIVQSVGGQIVQWWRANYPLIKQIVEMVSNAVKSTIGAFLNAVRGFWQEHGAAISALVATSWSYIKSIVSQGVDLIGGIIRLGLQIINGDWSGAWQTLLKIIENGAKLAATIWRGFLDTLGRLLAAIIPIAIEYGIKFQTTIATWFGKAVVGAVYIIATLPKRIIETVPKLIAAGVAIGKAIWEGIKEGAKQVVGLGDPDSKVLLSANNTYDQKTIDYSRPKEVQQTAQNLPSFDVGKMQDDADKLKKEREALAKSELSSQINLYRNQLSEVEKIYKENFEKITDIFKESNNPQQFQASFDQLKQWYGGQINELIPEWEGLVEKQTLAEKKGSFERLEVYRETQKRKEELSKNTSDFEDKANQLIKDSQKRLSEEQIKDLKQKAELQTQLAKSAKESGFAEADAQENSYARLKEIYDTKIALGDTDLKTILSAQQIERGYLVETQSRKLEMLQLEVSLRQQIYDLVKNTSDGKQAAIDLTAAKNAVKTADNQNKLELFKLDENSSRINQGNAANQLRTYQQALEDLNGKLTNNADLTEYARVQNLLLTDSYKNLSDAQKENLLNTAAQIDAQKTYNEQYKQTYDFIRNSLDILTASGTSFGDKMKSIFGGIADRFKKMLLDMTAQWLTSKVFGGGSAGGGSTSGSGGIQNIFKNLFGGGSGSSSGSGNIFSNPNVIRNLSGASSGGAAFGLTPDSLSNIPKELLNGGRGTGGGIGDLLGKTGGTSGGIGQTGISGLLQKIAGTPGIAGGFLGAGLGASLGSGSRTGSILGGIGGAIGGTLLTGLLTTGSIAGATTGGIFGASAGLFGLSGAATFGIGAAIAGVALLTSYLLSKNAQRRRDEQARTQYLHDAIGGLSGFDNLIADLRGLRIDSQSAIAQGTSLGASLRTQYLQQAGSLKDKKTREIALRSVSELDFNIAQKMNALRGASDFANAAADRKNRIIPEFATGAYMSPEFRGQFGDFKRRNGMLPGAFTGRDSLPSMLAPGEMVLNPVQQARVIRAAGGDVFKYGGIPGYADGVYAGNPQSESRPFFSPPAIQSAPANITVNPQFTLVLEGVAMDDRVEAYLLSERGERTYVKVDKKAKLGGRIRG